MTTCAIALASGDVRSHAEGGVLVRPAGARGAAGIDDHQVGAVPLSLEHVLEHDRMRLAGVRAPEHEHVRLLQLLVGRGAASGTEHGRQPGDRRGVSGPVAAVDVVRADHGAHELLRRVVQLVRGLRAREHADGVGPVGGPWRARARASPRRARRPRSSGRRTPSTRTRGMVSRPWTPEDLYPAMVASLIARLPPQRARTRGARPGRASPACYCIECPRQSASPAPRGASHGDRDDCCVASRRHQRMLIGRKLAA